MARGFWQGLALGTLAVVALALWGTGETRAGYGRIRR